MESKIFSLLGLCKRAGLLVAGEDAVEQAIKALKANLVIIAIDSSDNTKKKFSNMSQYRDLPVIYLGTKSQLGKSIGKELTASIAVLDKSFSEKIQSLFNEIK